MRAVVYSEDPSIKPINYTLQFENDPRNWLPTWERTFGVEIIDDVLWIQARRLTKGILKTWDEEFRDDVQLDKRRR